MALRLPFLTLLLTTFFCTGGLAQQSENMTLLGNWDDPTLTGYSDLWGYAANGREYAIMGSRTHIHILDVTDPSNIVEKRRLNSYSGSSTRWRDIKVYNNYAYCVTDVQRAEGLQIIDLNEIDNPAVSDADIIVFNSQQFWGEAHNIFIDETTDPVRLYAFGTNNRSNGYIALSLENPAAPVQIANTSLAQNGGYIHDAYVVNDTMYANSEGRGMFVYDVSNPALPFELGVLGNYGGGYNHSVWRTPDGKHAIMCDETLNQPVRVVNVEDPLDMQVESSFASRLRAPASNTTFAHNPYVLSNDRVVISYYGDGIQVWEFSDPANPTRLGYYDTTPNSTSASDGIWGAYPYLPSGRILGSDMANGLFVVELNEALPVIYESWSASSDGKHARLDWAVAEERNNAGWVVEHGTETGGVFAEIGWVPSGETVNTFFHAEPGPGAHYYRLRQRDVDGTEHLSEVRVVEFLGDERRAQTFPNPVRSGGAVTFKGLLEDTAWEVVDLAGRQVQAGVGRGGVLAGPGGVYFVRVGGVVVDRVVVF